MYGHVRFDGCPALAVAVVLGVTVSTGSAQTITVTTCFDRVDIPAAATIADLPGPDARASFREACTAANNTPNPQTVAFANPQAVDTEWSRGNVILFMGYCDFQLIDDETTGDFTDCGMLRAVHGANSGGTNSAAAAGFDGSYRFESTDQGELLASHGTRVTKGRKTSWSSSSNIGIR